MPQVIDQLHRAIAVLDRPHRVISLVPSQTELLHDLGLGDRVVGITKFCVHPEAWFRSKARVGGTKNVDIEKVRALRPDLIIGNKEENSQEDIEALEKEFPVWMSDVKTLVDAIEVIAAIGSLTGTQAKAHGIVEGVNRAFAELKRPASPLSAAYFIWRDPLMVAGGDTFISDMMQRAGFTNAFAHRKERYAEITPAELATADPDVILLSSEPFPFAQKHIGQFNMICPGKPVHLVNGEMFSWYGSRLLLAPEYFATLGRG